MLQLIHIRVRSACNLSREFFLGVSDRTKDQVARSSHDLERGEDSINQLIRATLDQSVPSTAED